MVSCSFFLEGRGIALLEGVSFVINEMFYTNFTVVCCMFIHILFYEGGRG
jgi:hypothetical protein